MSLLKRASERERHGRGTQRANGSQIDKRAVQQSHLFSVVPKSSVTIYYSKEDKSLNAKGRDSRESS